MSRTIKAVYEDGVLKPLEPLHLAEHAETYVTVEEESREPKWPGEPFPTPRKFTCGGIGDSGRDDISERAEEILAEGFGRR
ncbi:MAG: antitoxin family protein [Bdellovibrionota bacterium]